MFDVTWDNPPTSEDIAEFDGTVAALASAPVLSVDEEDKAKRNKLIEEM